LTLQHTTPIKGGMVQYNFAILAKMIIFAGRWQLDGLSLPARRAEESPGNAEHSTFNGSCRRRQSNAEENNRHLRVV